VQTIDDRMALFVTQLALGPFVCVTAVVAVMVGSAIAAAPAMTIVVAVAAYTTTLISTPLVCHVGQGV